jgi:hypothetical protein
LLRLQEDAYSLLPKKMASHAQQSQNLLLIEQQPMACQQQMSHALAQAVRLPDWCTDFGPLLNARMETL